MIFIHLDLFHHKREKNYVVWNDTGSKSVKWNLSRATSTKIDSEGNGADLGCVWFGDTTRIWLRDKLRGWDYPREKNIPLRCRLLSSPRNWVTAPSLSDFVSSPSRAIAENYRLVAPTRTAAPSPYLPLEPHHPGQPPGRPRPWPALGNHVPCWLALFRRW
jgi:hypothetical protein